MISLPPKFEEQVISANTSLIPFVVIGKDEPSPGIDLNENAPEGYGFTPIVGHDVDSNQGIRISTKPVSILEYYPYRENENIDQFSHPEMNEDHIFNYLPLLINIPNIKESIDIRNRKMKISNMNLQVSNAEYNGSRFADKIGSINGKTIQIYWIADTTYLHIDNAVLLFNGVVKNFKYQKDTITITAEDRTDQVLDEMIPSTINQFGFQEHNITNTSITDKYKQVPVPIVFGYADAAPLVASHGEGTNTYLIADSDPSVQFVEDDPDWFNSKCDPYGVGPRSWYGHRTLKIYSDSQYMWVPHDARKKGYALDYKSGLQWAFSDDKTAIKIYQGWDLEKGTTSYYGAGWDDGVEGDLWPEIDEYNHSPLADNNAIVFMTYTPSSYKLFDHKDNIEETDFKQYSTAQAYTADNGSSQTFDNPQYQRFQRVLYPASEITSTHYDAIKTPWMLLGLKYERAEWSNPPSDAESWELEKKNSWFFDKTANQYKVHFTWDSLPKVSSLVPYIEGFLHLDMDFSFPWGVDDPDDESGFSEFSLQKALTYYRNDEAIEQYTQYLKHGVRRKHLTPAPLDFDSYSLPFSCCVGPSVYDSSRYGNRFWLDQQYELYGNTGTYQVAYNQAEGESWWKIVDSRSSYDGSDPGAGFVWFGDLYDESQGTADGWNTGGGFNHQDYFDPSTENLDFPFPEGSDIYTAHKEVYLPVVREALTYSFWNDYDFENPTEEHILDWQNYVFETYETNWSVAATCHFTHSTVSDLSDIQLITSIGFRRLPVMWVIYLLEDFMSSDFYGRVRGRLYYEEGVNGEIPATSIITNILTKECNEDLTNIEIPIDSLGYNSSQIISKRITARKFIEDFTSLMPFIARYGNDGKFRYIEIPDYNTNNYNLIKAKDVIDFTFSRTPIEDVYQAIEFHGNYHHTEDRAMSIDTITIDDFPTVINSNYDTNYYGINSKDEEGNTDSTKYKKLILDQEVKKYIQIFQGLEEGQYGVNGYQSQTNTTRNSSRASGIDHDKIAPFLLTWYINQHLIIDLTLPISTGIKYEVGDIIAFDQRLHNINPFNIGTPKGRNYAGRVNGQTVFNRFLITEVNKTLTNVKMKVVQLHESITNTIGHSGWSGEIDAGLEGEELPGGSGFYGQPDYSTPEAQWASTSHFSYVGCTNPNACNFMGVIEYDSWSSQGNLEYSEWSLFSQSGVDDGSCDVAQVCCDQSNGCQDFSSFVLLANSDGYGDDVITNYYPGFPTTICPQPGTEEYEATCPVDCLGIPGGTTWYDCYGVCGGLAEYDECGICGGPGKQYVCCNGEIHCSALDCFNNNICGCSLEWSINGPWPEWELYIDPLQVETTGTQEEWESLLNNLDPMSPIGVGQEFCYGNFEECCKFLNCDDDFCPYDAAQAGLLENCGLEDLDSISYYLNKKQITEEDYIRQTGGDYAYWIVRPDNAPTATRNIYGEQCAYDTNADPNTLNSDFFKYHGHAIFLQYEKWRNGESEYFPKIIGGSRSCYPNPNLRIVDTLNISDPCHNSSNSFAGVIGPSENQSSPSVSAGETDALWYWGPSWGADDGPGRWRSDQELNENYSQADFYFWADYLGLRRHKYIYLFENKGGLRPKTIKIREGLINSVHFYQSPSSWMGEVDYANITYSNDLYGSPGYAQSGIDDFGFHNRILYSTGWYWESNIVNDVEWNNYAWMFSSQNQDLPTAYGGGYLHWMEEGTQEFRVRPNDNRWGPEYAGNAIDIVAEHWDYKERIWAINELDDNVIYDENIHDGMITEMDKDAVATNYPCLLENNQEGFDAWGISYFEPNDTLGEKLISFDFKKLWEWNEASDHPMYALAQKDIFFDSGVFNPLTDSTVIWYKIEFTIELEDGTEMYDWCVVSILMGDLSVVIDHKKKKHLPPNLMSNGGNNPLGLLDLMNLINSDFDYNDVDIVEMVNCMAEGRSKCGDYYE